MFYDGVQTIPYEEVQLLNYVAQVTAFTLGETVVGQISGASGVVFADANAGATGTLTLRNALGIFNPAEQILGSISGNATTNGAATTPAFTVTEIITGQLSGVTAYVAAVDVPNLTLVLHEVSGVFRASEHILGSVSGNAFTNGVVSFPSNPYVPLPTSNPTAVPASPSGTGPASGGTPPPMIWASAVRLCNDSLVTPLEYSFDGVNVHGVVPVNKQEVLRVRYEAGIAVRGNGAPFRIEAW
jgi:hypothetical protein